MGEKLKSRTGAPMGEGDGLRVGGKLSQQGLNNKSGV